MRTAISRRRFLKSSGVIAAGSAVPAWFFQQSGSHAAPARPLAANDKPNIALIGCGGQGRYDTTLAAKFANVVAVCDVDSKHAEEASKQFGSAKAYCYANGVTHTCQSTTGNGPDGSVRGTPKPGAMPHGV